MYARLSSCYVYTDESGVPGAFVVSNLIRYAGMLSGTSLDGRPVSRPLVEFDALSLDGTTWQPTHKLRHLIPWEGDRVPKDLCMPEQ